MSAIDTHATGELVEIEGEWCYRVRAVDRLAPFLMSVVSDGDRWMFISTSGALAAGRRDAAGALFPYITDDLLHQAGGMIGPATRVRVPATGHVWEPFASRPEAGAQRSVAKAVCGDGVRFEEHNETLGLSCSYRWGTSERYGFVRAVSLTNHGAEPIEIDVVDGLLDLLPAGLDPALYSRYSNLTQAYKRSELVDPTSSLAVVSLEAPVSDRAEPVEVLHATVAWSVGFDGAVTLDPAVLDDLVHGRSHHPAQLLTGQRGAYLCSGRLSMQPGETRRWHLVADTGCTHADIVALRHELAGGIDGDRLDAATGATGQRLAEIMSPADSMQHTGRPVACAHHVSNVTYNVMRGGIPLDGYRVQASDFEDFVHARNRVVAGRHAAWFRGLPDRLERADLMRRIASTGDVHLGRLGDEYLPFSFSRRHGDPSRPWNRFSIQVADDEGNPVVFYEGNWRDVFQNWEAVCGSFPEYFPSAVAVFVNASTADGYNPYRITRDGIDWEAPDPDDPWSNIGYWGDHQIVYLLRLLEGCERFDPGSIARRLTDRNCTFADVPYRIASYDQLIVDPKATITYDDHSAELAAARAEAIGGDGKLAVDADGELVLVTLIEKLIITALAKLSNYVPGGGIWMNTQRPEWNDANNALAGYGLSMVTLMHLRQFLDHLRRLAAELDGSVEVSSDVVAWLDATANALAAERSVADDPDRARRLMMDDLGRAGSAYRAAVYDRGWSRSTRPLSGGRVVELCDVAATQLDATIEAGRRPDGLVDSYLLLRITDDETARIERLPPMLEGQVAALAPGLIPPSDQADLVDALFDSELYRPDQASFLLAPAHRPPSFLDKNVIPASSVDQNPLLAGLSAEGDRRLLLTDVHGTFRFAPHITTEGALTEVLDELAESAAWAPLIASWRGATLDTFEAVFGHRSYLGRSGSMHAYEGIGSIYWHMVTKLLLAVQQAACHAAADGGEPEAAARLRSAYLRIRDGLGFAKPPHEFGAIPIDPYSHTPAHAGAQQPGMTGAVKEELLARPRELGVVVESGEIVFDPFLVDPTELLADAATWTVSTVRGTAQIELAAGSFGFTLCGVPVVVAAGDQASVEVTRSDGSTSEIAGCRLGRSESAEVFGRSGAIDLIRATLPLHR